LFRDFMISWRPFDII